MGGLNRYAEVRIAFYYGYNCHIHRFGRINLKYYKRISVASHKRLMRILNENNFLILERYSNSKVYQWQPTMDELNVYFTERDDNES